MFSKLLKLPFSRQLKSLSKPKVAHFSQSVTSSGSRVQTITERLPEDQRVGPSVSDLKAPLQVKDYVLLNYKTYPNVSHNDPHSKDYVHSERDEYHDKIKVTTHNRVIDGIKHDIKTQEEVYRIIERLDRSHKHGVPGNTKNITGGVKDYFPPADLGFKQVDPETDDKHFAEVFANEHRWVKNSVFHPRYTPIESNAEWQKELDSRPVNKHFHHDKGYKYDIETPWDQRYPHVADRMGYPEILGTPFERLMRLEGEIYHPTYLDQPFVQVPSSDPHPSLNFEEGEVVYENTNLLEWARFMYATGISIYAFSALFVPYSLMYKTHLPLASGYDNMFVAHYNHTMFYFDNLGLHIAAIGGIAMYATYVALSMSHKIFRDYVVKAQYSKDRELLFVTRISPLCSLEEEVFEMHHLEFLPPSVKSSLPDLSSQDADGLWDITCLASHRNLVMYNDEKYWNPHERKQFFDKVMNFWTPDLIKRNRFDMINDAINGEKIELGFDRPKLE